MRQFGPGSYYEKDQATVGKKFSRRQNEFIDKILQYMYKVEWSFDYGDVVYVFTTKTWYDHEFILLTKLKPYVFFNTGQMFNISSTLPLCNSIVFVRYCKQYLQFSSKHSSASSSSSPIGLCFSIHSIAVFVSSKFTDV